MRILAVLGISTAAAMGAGEVSYLWLNSTYPVGCQSTPGAGIHTLECLIDLSNTLAAHAHLATVCGLVVGLGAAVITASRLRRTTGSPDVKVIHE